MLSLVPDYHWIYVAYSLLSILSGYILEYSSVYAMNDQLNFGSSHPLPSISLPWVIQLAVSGALVMAVPWHSLNHGDRGVYRYRLFVEKQPRLAQGCVDAVCHCQPVKRLSPCLKEWLRYGVSIMGPRHVA